MELEMSILGFSFSELAHSRRAGDDLVSADISLVSTCS